MPICPDKHAGIILIAIVTLVVQSCTKETIGPKDVNGIQASVLDLNDPQYDWVWGHNDNPLCAEYNTIFHEMWYPKFFYHVVDISPDGSQLLVSTGLGIQIFDISTRTMNLIIGEGTFEEARWSGDGRRILVSRNDIVPLSQRFGVYSLDERTIQYIPLPDSVRTFWDTASWLPGDTTVMVGLMMPSSGRTEDYSVSLRPPYTIQKLSMAFNSQTVFFQGTTYFLTEENHDDHTGRSDVMLSVGTLKDLKERGVYRIKGTAWMYGPAIAMMRLSHDGNWLVFRMGADLVGSRFESTDPRGNGLTSLGVLDLRVNSPNRYQLHRIFPDHTNTYRNCASWGKSGMAISPDGRYVYHEWVRVSDSTTQIVRREVETGKTEEITNFLSPP